VKGSQNSTGRSADARTDGDPDPALLLKALNHPLRRRILRAVDPEGSASATQLSKRLHISLSNAVYHVKVMVKLEALSLVDERRIRGATESFYRPHLAIQANWVQAALTASREKDESTEAPP
jgi:DNA-binding transcriptional ArsR family regulator